MNLLKRFIVFAGVGVIGTSAHYIVLIALVDIGSILPSIASSIGFAVGALVNYLLNYRFTFASDQQHAVALPKFFTIALMGFFLNGLIMTFGTRLFCVHYIFIQIFATLIVLIWNFTGNSLWTFKNRN